MFQRVVGTYRHSTDQAVDDSNYIMSAYNILIDTKQRLGGYLKLC